MSRLASAILGTPLILGVALTIARHESRRQRRPGVGSSTRTVSLRIDPSVDLVYLAEATLPCSLPCLDALTRATVIGVKLLGVRLELMEDAPCTSARQHPTLTVLESGNCFVTAFDRKIQVASFGAQHVHPRHIDMEVLHRGNLLEFLRADWFTVELSGTHRRRLTKALPLSMQLEFEVHETTTATA
ncbi:hypothetical protein F0P96_00240 [Hymenobacter busanensis]|uniref:Uncharacterized protein n=1 Tax=Hymenobacter busanensis TaxID=2607656 RepID=A0A7L4ZVS9_9BACT|nr:hypothetical protein [Hymenobacter busanensis]KAA9339101.1 hypothetical protein F0P96_00240 [Hymenobacter busanensis]QHJ07137.1 hypothetical protein GUY19_07510 [Hymenobacter busanensis]